MQTIIDFLVNNYLWFIIIALILVFALIGYLVDTSEKANKKEIPEEDAKESDIEKLEPIESLNMDMGTEEIEELDKDIIVMPSKIEENSEETEVLEDFE